MKKVWIVRIKHYEDLIHPRILYNGMDKELIVEPCLELPEDLITSKEADDYWVVLEGEHKGRLILKKDAVVIREEEEGVPTKSIYISGKVTGLPVEEYTKNFQEAETYLESLGYKVVNPIKIEHPPGTETWREYMIGCIKALTDCDIIYMLTNWRDSEGAKVELAVANHLELDVIHQHRMMES